MFLASVVNHPQHTSRGAGDAWGAPGRAQGMRVPGAVAAAAGPGDLARCGPQGPSTLEVFAACVQAAMSHSGSPRLLPLPVLSNWMGGTGWGQMLLLQFV